MKQTKGKDIYWNTLIFTILAGLVSIALLLFMLTGSDLAASLSVFVIAVQLGLLVIIVVCVYRIIIHEQRIENQEKTGSKNTMSVSSCPDYWVKTEAKQCRNDGHVMIGTNQTVDLDDYDMKTIDDACSNVRRLSAPWTEVRTACAVFSKA